MTERTHPVALVTGAGSGIGRATAAALAATGHRVVVCGRRSAPLEDLAREHPGVVPVPGDVTEPGTVSALVETVSELGRMDVLVHNAGIFRFSPLASPDLAEARQEFELGVFAPMALTRALQEYFPDEGGAIIVISSNAGDSAVPGADAYAASKAAQNSLVRTWALELAGRKIRVNALAPAAVRTDVYASNGLSDAQVSEYFAFQDGRTPLGRSGYVDDIVPWINLLADPASAWVTGQVITLDGGLSLTSA